MKIEKSYDKLKVTEENKIKRIIRKSTQSEEFEDKIIIEHLLNVYINEKLFFKILCTPDNLDYLVLGYMFTQGYIESTKDVYYIYICEAGTRASVYLNGDIKNTSDAAINIISSACASNRLSEDDNKDKDFLKPLPVHTWKSEDVFMQMDEMKNSSLLFNETGGTHNCSLLRGGKVIYSFEDIGRHNAIDKIIGAGLIDDVCFADTILFTSGRIASDTVSKAVRAGIPVLASHSAPTDKAVRLAKKYNLTLLGFVRANRMNVYNF